MSDDDQLEHFLTAARLGNLYPKCQELKFDYESLLEVTESTVHHITTSLGEQLKLLKVIRKAKEENEVSAKQGTSSGVPATATVASSGSPSVSHDTFDDLLEPSSNDNVPTGNVQSNQAEAQPGSSLGSQDGPSSQGKSQKRPKTAGLAGTSANRRLRSITESQSYEQLDLRDLLLKDSICKCILQSYEEELADDATHVALSVSQRHKITAILVNFILGVTDSPNHRLFPILTKKVKDIFPTESEDTFYTAPHTENNARPHPIGKIPGRIKNEKAKLKLLGGEAGSSVCGGTLVPKPKSNLQAILKKPVTDEVNGAAAWLQHSRSPWPKVVTQWSLTSPLRFKDLFLHAGDPYVNDYIEKWPVLTHKSGHELILEDFRLLYPASENLLYEKWESFSKVTISLAKKDVNDKKCKELLQKLTSSLSLSNQASLILNILPGIRTSHALKNKVRVAIDEARNSYLIHVKVVGDVRTALSARRATLKGVGGQPIIVVVGPSEDNIEVCYVSIAKLLFRVDGVVEAFDLFFKSFHALHTAYPPESIHIWVTIQRAVYNFHTEWDTSVKHDWINAYKNI